GADLGHSFGSKLHPLDQRQPLLRSDQRALLRDVSDGCSDPAKPGHEIARNFQLYAQRALGEAARALDEPLEAGGLRKPESSFTRGFPNPLKRVAVAVGKLECKRNVGRQRMEETHAHAGFGGVAHHAEELATGSSQLGRADQKRETRRSALLGTVCLRRGRGKRAVLALQRAHKIPDKRRSGELIARLALRTPAIYDHSGFRKSKRTTRGKRWSWRNEGNEVLHLLSAYRHQRRPE